MKKLLISIATLILTLCVFTGCNVSEEECFNKAKEKLNNYTVEVLTEFSNSYYSDTNTTLYIANTNGKCVTSYGINATYSYYYKEENGTVKSYSDRLGWVIEAGATSIENATRLNCGYVEIFQSIFYDDFEKEDNYLVMKESARTSHSNSIEGVTIDSAKLTLKGETFETAIVVIQMSNTRAQISYKFYDFNKTNVNVPD